MCLGICGDLINWLNFRGEGQPGTEGNVLPPEPGWRKLFLALLGLLIFFVFPALALVSHVATSFLTIQSTIYWL